MWPPDSGFVVIVRMGLVEVLSVCRLSRLSVESWKMVLLIKRRVTWKKVVLVG